MLRGPTEAGPLRNQWYADNRDVVKWAVLIHLARRRGIETVVQVCMLRPSKPASALNADGAEKPVPPEVLEHFRDVRSVASLAERAGVSVGVIDRPFGPDDGSRDEAARDEYFRHIEVALKEYGDTALVVLLDPDTGLAPRNHDWRHVRAGEAAAAWRALAAGSVLVLYQHARRSRG